MADETVSNLFRDQISNFMDQIKQTRDNLVMALNRLRDQVDYYGHMEKDAERFTFPMMDADECKRISDDIPKYYRAMQTCVEQLDNR